MLPSLSSCHYKTKISEDMILSVFCSLLSLQRLANPWKTIQNHKILNVPTYTYENVSSLRNYKLYPFYLNFLFLMFKANSLLWSQYKAIIHDDAI